MGSNHIRCIRSRCASGLVILLASACAGSIHKPDPQENDPGNPPGPGVPGDPSVPGGGPPGGGGGGGGPGGPPAAQPNQPGPAPLRRLTVREYRNTVRDLLGVNPVSMPDLGIDQEAGGFSTGAPLSTSADVSRFLDSAQALADAAGARLATLLPCPQVPADAAGQAACARQFIVQFGRRAFRRPLANEEVDDLVAVYTEHRGTEINQGFPEAIRSLVAAMLVSPHFLYRSERGAAAPLRDGALLRFNAHEIASRLSYALWGSMPDEVLFQAADAGKLTTPDQIEQQARRMLADPRTEDAVADFHLQWLDVDDLGGEPPKDAVFKDHNPALVQAMLAEAKAFAAAAVLKAPAAGGGLAQLLTGTATTVEPALAKLYGAQATGAGPQPVTLDPAQRAGIFTGAAFLSMHATTGETNPVKRGTMVLRSLLCIEVEPPPNMEVGNPEPPAEGVTTRERFAQHAEKPCATCHRLTDPIGFAFEAYDAIGAWRTMDRGKKVDASGSLTIDGNEVRFAAAPELLRALAGSADVRSCLTTQWLRYLLRRTDGQGDRASLQAAGDAFRRSGNDLRELLVGLTRTPSFTHRAPSPGEVLP
jgi:hypothetical protein